MGEQEKYERFARLLMVIVMRLKGRTGYTLQLHQMNGTYETITHNASCDVQEL